MLFALDKQTLEFPPPHLSEPDGLLAMGGDLSTDRLLVAYKNGIFPWYEGDTILWWSPDPRFVLFPEELKISKSIRPLLNRNEFDFTINKSFSQVIHNCKTIKRYEHDHGTWITDEVEKAYNKMHELGHAHSAEVWKNGELVGGLYGIRINNVFCGESMFSKVSNASRYCFIKYVQALKHEGVKLIDCQIYSEYLESLGGRFIGREEFVKSLNE